MIVLAVAGCGGPPPAAAPGSATAPAAPTITVVKLEQRGIKRIVELPGSVMAFEETPLFAKVTGFVKAIAADPAKAERPAHDRLIDIGSRVTAGQLLAELAVPELDEEFKQHEAMARQAEAEVTQSQKALAASTAGVASAQAFVAEAKAVLARAQALHDRWQSEAARTARLVTGGVIDAQTRDETLNQFKAAEAGKAEATAKVASREAAVVKAEADRDKSTADIAAAEARRDVARAGVRRMEALRSHMRIAAPYDGVLTRRSAATGDFITADGKHALFAVARIDPVRVVVNVPEADAALVTPGRAMRITFPNAPLINTTIARTSWALAPGARTLRAEADLANADGTLRPGMFATTRITADLPADWALPATALVTINDEPMTHLVENGKAIRVAVQVLRGDGQFTQVKQYKRAGAKDWTPFTGVEMVASPASAITDGQAVP
jgi:RND family efflux transporter MFP subunit